MSYGAVVGVPNATERTSTGREATVDGSTETVVTPDGHTDPATR